VDGPEVSPPEKKVPTRVAIVEDHADFRETLREFLANLPDFQPVASFGAAETALDEARRRTDSDAGLGWDLLLMDVELPRMNGIEATRRMRDAFPDLPIVVLTVFESPKVILDAITAGASGYLLKKTGARELTACLRSVVEGGAPLSPAVAATLLEIVRRSRPRDGEADPGSDPRRLDLTPREIDVLRCLADGRTYAGTAAHLGISESTVRVHVRGVYRKLQVHSVAAAVRIAIESGLV
jgi:DNA-binding NarL/FixJ family response regulator